VIDPDAGVVTAWPSPGDGPVSVAAAPDGLTAYVATLHDARVTLLDTAVLTER
jgi:DNA-binding beta-propeller fold protein YncE